MARLFTLATFVVGGLIFADILLHPQGVQAAASGINTVESPIISGLLGR